MAKESGRNPEDPQNNILSAEQLTVAEKPGKIVTWARGFKKRGFNSKLTIIGEVLSVIAGDDRAVIFGVATGEPFTPEHGIISKKIFDIRLGIESSVPELPKDLSDRLIAVKDKAGALDWGSEQGFNAAYKVWQEERQRVMEEVKQRPELNEAYEYRTGSMSTAIESLYRESGEK
jgi:hypothetical protein